MRKLFITILFVFLIVNLCSQIIARVDEYEITEEQLLNEMEAHPFSEDYDSLRTISLHNLIKNVLLSEYAKDNFIFVNDAEVENFFIANYGNHPKLQTNNIFDEQKFIQLKSTPEMQTILKEISHELLLIKTEEIIKAQYNINDDQLLEKYVMENASFDLSYAIINDELSDFPPTCTADKARNYFNDHKNEFMTEKSLRLSFFIVSDESFQEDIEISEDELMGVYDNLNIVKSFEEIRDSIRNELILAESHKKAYLTSISNRKLFVSEINPDYQVLLSDYLQESDTFGNSSIPNIVPKAFKMKLNEVSEPIDIGNGYLVFKIDDIRNQENAHLEDVTTQVWKKYVEFETEKSQAEKKQNFYAKHSDSFITPTARINRFVIDPSCLEVDSKVSFGDLNFYIAEHSDELTEIKDNYSEKDFFALIRGKIIAERKKEKSISIIKTISDNKNNSNLLAETASKNNLKYSHETIFLRKYKNSDAYNEAIAKELIRNKSESVRSLEIDNVTIVYFIENYFPEYLPQFEDIKTQFNENPLYVEAINDTADYYQYYLRNQSKFISGDSLSFGGIFVPILYDSVSVSEEEMKTYYQNNKEEFYRSESVMLQTIFIKDPDFKRRGYADKIYSYAKDEMDFALLVACYDERGKFETKKPVLLNELPLRVQLSLGQQNDIIEPVYFDSGWYIFRINKKISGRYLTFEQSKFLISEKIRKEKALNYSHTLAKKLFDSVNSLSQCASIVDKSWLFETNMTSVNDKFYKLGDLQQMQKSLLKLRHGDKYNSVIKTDEGFAVVFIKDKNTSQQLQYEKAYTSIIITHREEFLKKKSRVFASNLLKRIKEGANPNTELLFFGGWRSLKDLTLDSAIPGIDQSSLIIKDIVRKRQGDFSHLISISDSEYLFYRIDRMQKISNKDFLDNKETYRKNFLDRAFNNWLDFYKASHIIEIYQ